MSTKSDEVLEALKSQLAEFFSGDDWEGGEVLLERNDDLPEEIPAGGYINIIDGTPGEPDFALGFDGPYTYSHEVEIEIWVAHYDKAERNALYSALLAGIDTALGADITLGGVASGMVYGAPSNITRPVMGGDDLKSSVLRPVIDYDSPKRMSV